MSFPFSQLSQMFAKIDEIQYLSALLANIGSTNVLAALGRDLGEERPNDAVLTAIIGLEVTELSALRGEALAALSHLAVFYGVNACGTSPAHRLFVSALYLHLTADAYHDESPGVESEALATIVDALVEVDASLRADTVRFVCRMVERAMNRVRSHECERAAWSLGLVGCVMAWFCDLVEEASNVISDDIRASRIEELSAGSSSVRGLRRLLPSVRVPQLCQDTSFAHAVAEIGRALP